MLIVAAAAVTLTGCAVSDEERAACESQGGEVVHERFKTGREGFWDRDESRTLTFCKMPDGTIGEVFDDEVPVENSSGKRKYWATSCRNEGGRLWDAEETQLIGKVTFTYHDYICVAAGKVTAVHFEDDDAS